MTKESNRSSNYPPCFCSAESRTPWLSTKIEMLKKSRKIRENEIFSILRGLGINESHLHGIQIPQFKRKQGFGSLNSKEKHADELNDAKNTQPHENETHPEILIQETQSQLDSEMRYSAATNFVRLPILMISCHVVSMIFEERFPED